ncbi:MAG TPA: CPXCG motif-containing cysteine-rich protein [Bdellovibrionota bacterium]|jgi:hypothetical protein|nr:CPXCG motif-containing cysteine-rich protein [Bdellovibrionota bacterium]
MNFGTEEVSVQCPYCFETISIVVESLYGEQDYVEDCEVCCRPIRFYVHGTGDGEVPQVTATRDSGN